MSVIGCDRRRTNLLRGDAGQQAHTGSPVPQDPPGATPGEEEEGEGQPATPCPGRVNTPSWIRFKPCVNLGLVIPA